MTTPATVPKAPKEKKRALPTEFQRQVKQIRADIATVKGNLLSAERSLAGVPPSAAVPVNAVPVVSAPTSATTATPIAPAPAVGVKEEPEAESR